MNFEKKNSNDKTKEYIYDDFLKLMLTHAKFENENNLNSLLMEGIHMRSHKNISEFL